MKKFGPGLYPKFFFVEKADCFPEKSFGLKSVNYFNSITYEKSYKSCFNLASDNLDFNENQFTYPIRPNFQLFSKMSRVIFGDINKVKSFEKSRKSENVLQDKPSIPGGIPDSRRSYLFKNTSSCFFRLTNSFIPTGISSRELYPLPFGALVNPLGANLEYQRVLLIKSDEKNDFRCIECQGYINFSCNYIENGKKWICGLCNTFNVSKNTNFFTNDEEGFPHNVEKRLELCNGTIEFEAPSEYSTRPPGVPLQFFIIDVSSTSTSSGFLELVIDGILQSVKSLENRKNFRIGLLCFNSKLHFFKFGKKTRTYTIEQINDPFVPSSIEQQLLTLPKDLDKLISFIKELPKNFSNSKDSGASIGAALKCTLTLMKTYGGKCILFTNSRPNCGPGLIKNNCFKQRKWFYSNLRSEQLFYRQLAVEMSRFQIAVDLILSSEGDQDYIDVATLSSLSKYTCGEIFFLNQKKIFFGENPIKKVLEKIFTRETGWEAVMKIRFSKGIKIQNLYGRFFLKGSNVMALPNIDSSKTFSFELESEKACFTEERVCMQIALLYTTSIGERRIRVHTITCKTTTNPIEFYKNIDMSATTNLLQKMLFQNFYSKKIQTIKTQIQELLTNSLICYRKILSQFYFITTQLFLPSSLVLLPLHFYGMLKSSILNETSLSVENFYQDEKSANIEKIEIMSPQETSALFYPNVILVYSVEKLPNFDIIGKKNYHLRRTPVHLPCSKTSFRSDRVLLIDDGLEIIIWIGRKIITQSPHLLGSKISSSEKDLKKKKYFFRLFSEETETDKFYPWVKEAKNFLQYLSQNRSYNQATLVCFQGDSLEINVLDKMKENNTLSERNYYEFIKEVQSTVPV